MLNPASLSDDDRRAYMLMTSYEQERQKLQPWYRAFNGVTEQSLKTPTWSQFRTVGRWLDEQGWSLTTIEVHWSGYVKHAFATAGLLMPGQLRNFQLLRSYVRAPANVERPGLSDAELDRVYKGVLAPHVQRIPHIRRYLGIETPDAD